MIGTDFFVKERLRSMQRLEVEHIAKLARLELTPEEIDGYQREFAEILAYIQILERVDTEAVEAGTHVPVEICALRIDEPAESLAREISLGQASGRTEEYFKTPKISG